MSVLREIAQKVKELLDDLETLEQQEKTTGFEYPFVVGDECFFINVAGEEKLPFIYDEAEVFYQGKWLSSILCLVKKDGKWGFINQKGEQIIPFLYDDASYFTEGLALVKKGAKYGYINDKNETVFPFIYDDGALFENGKAWVQIGDKQFEINKLGIEIK